MTMSLTGNASQATQVEQARAVAEVAASVRAAQDRPRNEDEAAERFIATCRRRLFAEGAFWRFARGGEQLTGTTIDFAVEALRCWGNAVSGSVELVRRPGESEMLAFAWDLERNFQRRVTFVNPHTGYTDSDKDKKGNPKPLRHLVQVRDIREKNASAASRVEREQILAVLPRWYVEMGEVECRKTLAGDATIPLEDRRRAMIDVFGKRGITRKMMEDKIGLPSVEWVDDDLATLDVIARSIAQGRTTVEQEFRPAVDDRARTRASDLGDGVSTAPVDQPPTQPPATGDTGAVDTDRPTKTRLNAMFAVMSAAGLGGRSADIRAKRLRLTEILIGRDVASSDELTAAEVEHVITVVERYGDDAQEEVATLLAQDADERDRAEKEPGDDPADGSES